MCNSPKPIEAAPDAGDEKRVAPNGDARTFPEFVEFYPDDFQWYWDNAKAN